MSQPHRTYQCPACKNPVDRDAIVCSNAPCRKELAFCSSCRDVTTYSLVEKSGRFSRTRYRCERCQQVAVRCFTWIAGGYCNGLARAGGAVSRPLCANCSAGVSSVGRTVVSWTLMGALGGLLRRRPR